jgi:hypothetical protein
MIGRARDPRQKRLIQKENRPDIIARPSRLRTDFVALQGGGEAQENQTAGILTR